jgi:hypothetical protein
VSRRPVEADLRGADEEEVMNRELDRASDLTGCWSRDRLVVDDSIGRRAFIIMKYRS